MRSPPIMTDAADHRYMSRALELARHGLYTTHPNPRVGCVLVRDGEIVGEGWHLRAGEAHAEIHALRQAGERARGATAYVTLEPCCHTGRTPPCTQALIAAGIIRVVAAMIDPNPAVAGHGLAQLEAAGITVEYGVLQAAAEALNPGFIQRMRLHRPYVRCKLAMSVDGRTAMANGESKWITSAAARRDVQRLRARSGAIMTGIATVLADDPALTVRWDEVDDAPDLPPQPLRVVVDSSLRMPRDARLLTPPGGHTLVITRNTDTQLQRLLRRPNVDVLVQPEERNATRVDLTLLMHHLATLQINEVQLEAGPTLSGAMLAAGLVDELVIYMAPRLLGDTARGLFHLPGLKHLGETITLEIMDIRAVGEDWRITARAVLIPPALNAHKKAPRD